MDIGEAVETAKAAVRADAREQDAVARKAYLKVPYALIGHRVPRLRQAARGARKACPKPPHNELLGALNGLWHSDLYEDKLLAILLAGYFETLLTSADVSKVFLDWSRSLVGWSLLDGLAIDVMGRIALREPSLFEESREWVGEPSFWVRRAALLIHLPAIRTHALRADILQGTMEALVEEREFFIAKAMGWVLREMFDRLPMDAERLYLTVGPRAAALTRREALRKLDPEHRDRIRAAVTRT